MLRPVSGADLTILIIFIYPAMVAWWDYEQQIHIAALSSTADLISGIYPLPAMDSLLVTFRGNKYLVLLTFILMNDLMWGSFTIKWSERSNCRMVLFTELCLYKYPF